MFPKFYWYNSETDFFLFGAGIKQGPLSDNDWTFTFRDFFGKKRKTPLWEPFPERFSFSPRIVITNKGKVPKADPEWSSFSHSPDYPLWESNIAKALSLIDKRALKKVVLARMTTTEYNSPLLIETPTAPGISFAICLDENHVFFGNTPETLFQRKGISLFTEAVAGTRKIDDNKEQFLADTKERNEFFFVRDTILQKLSPICSKISYQQDPMIKKTLTLQHLWSPIQATLLKNLPDEFLVDLLHPTPAVGGLPSQKALDFLYTLEPFDRGLYAAPIGIRKKDFSHYIVAIRSSLLKENKLHSFAGTGIVKGSSPQLEWEELNRKSLITSALR